MKKVKQLKGWGIFRNNDTEQQEHGFAFTVLHPDNMEYSGNCTPRDTDMECDTLERAIAWIENY